MMQLGLLETFTTHTRTIRLVMSLLVFAGITIQSQDLQAGSRTSSSTEADLNLIRGIIKPTVEAVISGEIQARIIGLPFTEGQRFRKGQILVSFDCAKHHAELKVSQAEYQARKHMLESNLEMAKLNAIGELEVAISAADLKKARASMAIAKTTMDRCRIFAPFSGRVVKTFVNLHESINPYDELLSIIDESQFEIELILPSTSLLWVHKGSSFSFTIDETQHTYKAKVKELGASIDPGSQTLRVRGLFHKQPKMILSGMSGTASFPDQPEEISRDDQRSSFPEKPIGANSPHKGGPAKKTYKATQVPTINTISGSHQGQKEGRPQSLSKPVSNQQTSPASKPSPSKGKPIPPKATIQPSLWDTLMKKFPQLAPRTNNGR